MQEMANPKVRPLLEFYPEDTGKYLANANQGSQWLREMNADFTTPMICQDDQDFYIYEPTLLIDHRPKSSSAAARIKILDCVERPIRGIHIAIINQTTILGHDAHQPN